MENFKHDPAMCYDTLCKLSANGDVPHPRAGHPIETMSDREIAEETLFWLRQAGTALAQLQSGGMGAMMSGMIGNMFSKGK